MDMCIIFEKRHIDDSIRQIAKEKGLLLSERDNTVVLTGHIEYGDLLSTIYLLDAIPHLSFDIKGGTKNG